MNPFLYTVLLLAAGGAARHGSTTGIVKVTDSPVQVDEGKILRVVSGKAAFTLAGPKGTTFRFQPKVAADSHWVSASLQVNGVDVAVGKFENGVAPTLGYSPSNAEEVAIYRATSGDSSANLAVYQLKLKSDGFHDLLLKVVDGALVPAAKAVGPFLLFGPQGLVGKTQDSGFSADLNDYPSGQIDFDSVYVNGDYAEAPEVSHVTIEPRLSIQGVDRALSRFRQNLIHLVDLHDKGIVGARVKLNGRPVAEFSNIRSGVTLDLSGFESGSYRMEVFGLLADGTQLGPDTCQVELDQGGGTSVERQTPPTLNDFILISAYYGASNGMSKDVTAKVSELLRQSTHVLASNTNFGDPASGYSKQLVINYTLRGRPGTLTCGEQQSIDITDALPLGSSEVPQTGAQPIRILSADYQGVDVTAKVRDMVAHGSLEIPVESNALGIPDPAPGVFKTLTINLIDSYGVRRQVSGIDGKRLSLIFQSSVLTLFDKISNGSFGVQETPGMLSEMKYVPPGNGVLGQEGVYTVAYGMMRPYQLHNDFRLDFVQHTPGGEGMAMFIHPKSGRQPMVLWAEKVKVQPNTRYVFECYCADLSEDDPTAYAAVTLQADDAHNKPSVFDTADVWNRVSFTFTSGSNPYVTLKIWRDVLPDYADSGSLIGIDDISLTPVAGGS